MTATGPVPAPAPTRARAQDPAPAPIGDFGRLIRAEWTKLRTVRGWAVAMAVAVLLTVALGVLTTSSARASNGCAPTVRICGPLTGPGGEPVSDSFTFVHRPLDGDGTITARVTALTGQRQLLPPGPGEGPSAKQPTGKQPTGKPSTGKQPPGLEPWAKTGLLIKASTQAGSSYAAVMVTGAHGVRMQDDFTHDTAGPRGAVTAANPRWLRLTRDGALITGYASADGTHWTKVGAARLPALPRTVQAGPFAASPQFMAVDSHFLGQSASSGPTRATGVLDHLALEGPGGTNTAWPQAGWQATRIGDDPTAPPIDAAPYQLSGGRLTVNGTGDIAPGVGGQAFGGRSIERDLAGTFAGLVVLIVIGTSFVTSEYRRGLIRTTLAAEPRRGRVLAAKAVVMGAAAFVVGGAAAALAVVVGGRLLDAKGVYVQPVGTATQLRVIVGTAVLLAVASVLALAAGTALRRAAGAVTAVTAVTVLPYVLVVSAAVPAGTSRWLLRVTPAAAFAVQQTLSRYRQVDNLYTPSNGYYPLTPWEGLAVLCGYAALALGLAYVLLRRRDA